jgi:hypothetical protein
MRCTKKVELLVIKASFTECLLLINNMCWFSFCFIELIHEFEGEVLVDCTVSGLAAMDAALLHSYRLIWADVTMLLDTATIYYSRRPTGGYSLTDFAAGLSLLIKKESDEEESGQHHEEEDVVDFTEGMYGICLYTISVSVILSVSLLLKC